jgi:neutrophil factor 2
MLCDKFDTPNDFRLRFRDEEGDQVSLKDEGDWEAALDCAKVAATGRPEGKLDVWVL